MRLYNWESRLTAYICRISREGFAYGTHDCALFAAGGVEAVTGLDPAAAWRGRYRTELGGLRLLRKNGHVNHIRHARALFPPLMPGRAMAGDLAVIPDGGLGALGIVQGEMVYVLRPDPRMPLGLVPIGTAIHLLAVR